MSAKASPGFAISGSISTIESWLSPKSSSSAAANIPFEIYLPNILRLPITNGTGSFTDTGTIAPGAIQAANIPTRTLGAPQSTSIKPSTFSTLGIFTSPASILHKVKCVFGIFSASATRTA